MFLKNIKINNLAITGDCPVCDYQDIGFNYGGNNRSFPINCGWAGSFQFDCPYCGTVFAGGDHHFPSENSNTAIHTIDSDSELIERAKIIKENKEYLESWEKQDCGGVTIYSKKLEKYELKVNNEMTKLIITNFVGFTSKEVALPNPNAGYFDKYATGREGTTKKDIAISKIREIEKLILGDESDELFYLNELKKINPEMIKEADELVDKLYDYYRKYSEEHSKIKLMQRIVNTDKPMFYQFGTEVQILNLSNIASNPFSRL
jgi:hypothetical protein